MALKQLFIEDELSGRAGDMPRLLVRVRCVCTVRVHRARGEDAPPAAEAVPQKVSVSHLIDGAEPGIVRQAP
jgi:hypothetical protein